MFTYQIFLRDTVLTNMVAPRGTVRLRADRAESALDQAEVEGIIPTNYEGPVAVIMLNPPAGREGLSLIGYIERRQPIPTASVRFTPAGH